MPWVAGDVAVDGRFRDVLAIMALVIWGASAVDSFITQNFTPLAISTSLVTVLAGGLGGYFKAKDDKNAP